jgi:serine protease Do
VPLPGTLMTTGIDRFTRIIPLLALASLSPALPALAEAQGARGQGGTTRVTERKTSACAELSAMPTVLALTPEGRSVVKLQREIDAAAQAATVRGEQVAELRSIVRVQKGVDSLMQILIRHLNDAEGRPSILLRTDSALRIDVSRPTRGQIEAQIRELQPRVAALAGAAGHGLHPGTSAGTGWLGLRISGSFLREVSTQGVVTRYCDDYPVIEAVDPGSPGEKAGLQSGDTLLAFNGRDVLAQPIVHSQLFVPGQQLRVRVRRVGRTRELPLVVGEPRGEQRFVVRGSPGVTSACAGDGCLRTFDIVGTAQPTRMVPLRASVAGASGAAVAAPGGMIFLGDGGSSLVGGAQMAVVSEELAGSLGLEQGLLLVRVLTGTPMFDAGLRVGDVIRQVNGAPARDVGALQRAFAASSREARLSVAARGQAPRTVVVRW